MTESIKIVVLERGRIRVGYLSLHPDLAFHWRMRGGRIIRQWGTAEGLEQIAEDGPTESTKLDRPCDTTFPFKSVIEILDATEEPWKKHLMRKPLSSKRPAASKTR